MKIVIAGGTGFLGNPLAWAWAEESHDVRVLTRSLPAGQSQHESGTGKPGITRIGWSPDGHAGELARELEGAAAVINLAGESIAGGRWTAARKQALRDSRILATRSLATALADTPGPAPTFISGSGVGYYGDRGAEPLSEESTPGDDFLAHLCVEWEGEASAIAKASASAEASADKPAGQAAHAESPARRVVLLRTGVVLEKSGGALPQMMRPFRFFAGGPIGTGRQYIPWIHRLDWIEMVRWIVDTPAVNGPINVAAPHPVTNAEFSRALGRAMHRPALVPAPAFAVRLALGEMADAALASTRAIPAKALAHGYHFRYPEIDIAFRGIFGD